MRYGYLPLVLLALGCGKSPAPKVKEVIALDQAPIAVIQAARKKEPSVKFTTILKTPSGIYEVQGKTKEGKTIEVEVNEAGDVVAVE